jgi:anti-anti-sigma factor
MSTTPTDPAPRPNATGTRAVQRARPGDHLCAFHGTRDEQSLLATAFIRAALGAGDRVLHVASRRSPEATATLFERSGLGVSVANGQLTVVDFAQIYGAPGELDVHTVLSRYEREAGRARAHGYPGLRIAAEMGDFVGALGSVEAVERWERTLTKGFAEAGILGLCQYDRQLVASDAQAAIAAAHPAVAIDDGTSPITLFTATDTASGLAVAGEIDVSTAPAFARALRARTAVSPHVHVDLGELGFVDVAGLRTVFDVAEELPPGATVVLDRTSPAVRRVLSLLGWSHPRVVVG